MKKMDSESACITDSVIFKPRDMPVEISVAEAKRAWKLMDQFLQQQQTSSQINKRTQRELENKIYDLERQIEQQGTKGKLYKEMEDMIKQQSTLR